MTSTCRQQRNSQPEAQVQLQCAVTPTLPPAVCRFKVTSATVRQSTNHVPWTRALHARSVNYLGSSSAASRPLFSNAGWGPGGFGGQAGEAPSAEVPEHPKSTIACLDMDQSTQTISSCTCCYRLGSMHFHSLGVRGDGLADHLVQGHELATLHELEEAVICDRPSMQHQGAQTAHPVR